MLVPLLAGCAVERTPITGKPSASGAPAPAASSDPGATPAPADAPGTPIGIDCTALVSAQTMYDYNSNFLLVPSYTADADSAALEVHGYHGLVCAWQNSSSGEIISVSVADLPTDVIDGIRGTLTSDSTAVSDFGTEGYFGVSGGIGRADAFSGSYWIVAESSWFLGAQDAEPLMRSAITALGG
jgi:hypothetical protein